MKTYLKFWGTRGSIPVSGKEYIRFGGNSSCLEIRDGKTLVIIDAGTGLRAFKNPLNKIDLFISHSHIDHIGGFPFFLPLFDPHANITIWDGPGESNAEALFTKKDAQIIFPGLVAIHAKVTFNELKPKTTFSCGTIKVSAHQACHPGLTFGFKIETRKTTFAYITDNEVFKGHTGSKTPKEIPPFEKSLISFLKGCDFIIHEAQYTPAEYKKRIGWGHSSVSNAAFLLKEAGVKKWYVTHHDPDHTDKDLLKKQKTHQKLLPGCKVIMAYDGLVVKL